MPFSVRFFFALLVLDVAPAKAAGEVKLPLGEWEKVVDEIALLEKQSAPEPGAAIATRRIEAGFARGVLTGSLLVELDATVGKEPLAVPLIGATASLGEVRLDGELGVATRLRDSYAVLVSRSGRHRVELRFVAGEEQDRFARAILLPLPPAPVTRLTLDLPEADLEIQVEGGAVLSQSRRGAGTRVEAALGNTEALSVRWQRRSAHDSQTRESEARAYVLASVREDVVRCETVLAYRVLSGETGRFEIELPPALEVTHVTGDAVLQWTTQLDPSGGRKLLVLLRHLVDDGVTIGVHTQMPRASGATELKLVRPLDAVLREGFIAIEGRSGMEITVVGTDGASEVGTRELPRELVDLSQKPLLFGYRYEKVPRVALAAKRNAEVELTEVVVDVLEAATVVAEQGLEVTKVRLFVRNNTRQYLALELPPGATLTHALIDGTPFHPAVSRPAGGPEVLLVPLRQSERVKGGGTRVHRVRPGETLGRIALRYFSSIDGVQAIIAENAGLDPEHLVADQELLIPRGRAGTTIDESSFAVELAYKHDRGRLRWLGSQSTLLPQIDLRVMAMSWQFFFPEGYEPLVFSTNLKQHSAVRYGPLDRALQFLGAALSGRRAWAGSDYSNILSLRKEIFQLEQKTQVTEALAAFPLVGERYRFSRVLLGDRRAEVGFVYARRDLLVPLRILAFLSAVALVLWATRRARTHGLLVAAIRGRGALVAAAVLLLWLAVAQIVLGVHRSLLWGVNVGLVASLARAWWTRGRSLYEAPPRRWDWSGALRLGTLLKLGVVTLLLGVIALFPMLLGLALLTVLLGAHARTLRRGTLAATIASALLVTAAALPAHAQEVSLPLETWSGLRARLTELRTAAADRTRQVVVGETVYRGRAETAGLRLHLGMRVQLGDGSELRHVPIVGGGVVLLSATSGGRPVALTRHGDGWVWPTRQSGTAAVDVDMLVPPSGRRGSLEYRFGVVESPATQITCVFPQAGLSPKVTGAVTNQVRPVAGGTELVAALGPVRAIHVVGFHDIESESDARAAKLYAESQNLFSLGDDGVELFSVVKLAILYAPQKRFRIALPQGYDLVKADGEGAFQYGVAEENGRRVLTGETAYGIRQSYEISLRLVRPRTTGAAEVPLGIPGLLGVERDSGFVAVEVPGKLSIEKVDGGGLRRIDPRELPVELIESSVTPIVRAFQYAAGGGVAVAHVARYAEKTLAPGGVDELRAETVLTGDGAMVTELIYSLRNNLQQYLALSLPDGAQVRSAFLESEPVKPSRDANGSVLLPLVRSPQGATGLRPIHLRVVYESRVPPLGAVGWRTVALPTLAVPLASLRWTLHSPSRYAMSALRGRVGPQRFVRHASWQPPPDLGAPWAVQEPVLDHDRPRLTPTLPEALEAQSDGSLLDLALEAPAQTGPGAARPSPGRAPPPGEYQAGADAAGAMSVRIDLPRSGKHQTYVRYWIGDAEPLEVSFRFVGTSWLVALELAVALAVALLLGLAAWPGSSPLAGGRRRRAAATGAAVAVGGATVGFIAVWPVALGVLAAAAAWAWASGHARRTGVVLGASGRESLLALRTQLERARDGWVNDFVRRREHGVLGALAATGGAIAWSMTKLVVLASLLAALLGVVTSLLGVLGNPA